VLHYAYSRLTVISLQTCVGFFSVDLVQFSLCSLLSAGRATIWYRQNQARTISYNLCHHHHHQVMVLKWTLQQRCGSQSNNRRQTAVLHTVLQTVLAAVNTSNLSRSSLIVIFIDLSRSEPVQLLHATVLLVAAAQYRYTTVPFNDSVYFAEETQNPHCLGKCFMIISYDPMTLNDLELLSFDSTNSATGSAFGL